MRFEKGFSLIEVVVVIVIIGGLSLAALPQLRQYNSRVDLRNTSQLVRDSIRTLQNKAINGELATENLTSKDRSYWAMRIDNTADNYYEIAPCATFNFASCTSSADYERIKLPDKFHLTHTVTGKTRIAMFFSPIDGTMVAYDSTPTLINSPTITLRLSSDEYTTKHFTMIVNAQGNIATREI